MVKIKFKGQTRPVYNRFQDYGSGLFLSQKDSMKTGPKKEKV